ncbi:MAG: dihydroorotate dehydrogenase-like protein [Calditrichaceae bacterium]|nr:dihydroorotate dehydrogenase-like protein [Calditrichaceae bacterium]MBN2709618.1 dihydroorotate dehydrogenase-like protein [Calditrichaceae bacterium]RQV92415.1 MAG: dihydroorotate dehydrogenase-like protein [Calditrichota bacterium]
MNNLKTDYMGLRLKNPIIAASSGLTKSTNKIKACEDAGAGAIVIKSLFEEALVEEDKKMKGSFDLHTEAYEYMRAQIHLQYGPDEYCKLIAEAKKQVKIPVIASINCISGEWWVDFARKIEKAGADALELNIFPMTSDETKSSAEIEENYYKTLLEVKNNVQIPVAMKISMYITALPHLVVELEKRGLNGLVLFNRFVEPDIDINKMTLRTTFPFSRPDEMHQVLRWTAVLSDKTDVDISATTGIHTSEAIIKLILAGASTVQLASVLYKQGFKVIDELLQGISSWMNKYNYDSINSFKAKVNFGNTENPDLYLRSQFMERIREID